MNRIKFSITALLLVVALISFTSCSKEDSIEQDVLEEKAIKKVETLFLEAEEIKTSNKLDSGLITACKYGDEHGYTYQVVNNFFGNGEFQLLDPDGNLVHSIGVNLFSGAAICNQMEADPDLQ